MKATDQLFDEISNNPEEMLTLLRETAEMVAFYRRLLDRNELDNLTGLPGSNSFRIATSELERRTADVGVIFFDVNDLKYYNDVKGHQAGDLLLQKAAESIHLACSSGIRAFRIGGDEFVALLTNCRESDIDVFLARWREKLAELNSADDGIHCSISVGAAFGCGEYQISDVLKLADERMYEDKRRIKADRTPPG